MLIEYEIQNIEGTLVFAFAFTNVIFNTCRNTFARLLILIVSLGVGIVITPQQCKDRYFIRIILLSILYSFSNAVYLVSLYINQTTPLS